LFNVIKINLLYVYNTTKKVCDMSIDFVESFTVQLPDFKDSNIDFSESFNSKHGLIIEVAAIHEGLTANYNNYSADELAAALESWVSPYPKPIILNHDLNTEPIGRVMAAKMDKEEDGSSFVRLQIAITDPVAAQKVLDKRYLTGSVGGRAGKAVCSISGEDLAQETDSGRPRLPKYKRGKVYKGKLAYIDMQDISFKEYSFVNQPADQKSGVRSTSVKDGSAAVADSENWVAKSAAFVLSMDTEDIVSVQENESILKGMRKKESRPAYLQLKGAFLTALAAQEMESDINEDDSLLSCEDSEKVKSEENSIMDDVTKEEDILAVATGLSEDLSSITSSTSEEEVTEESNGAEEDVQVSEEEEAVADSEVSEETSQEGSETVNEETVEEDKAQESSADDSEEADVQNVDSENAGKPEESSSGKVEIKDDEVQEEADQDGDLITNESSDEQDIEQLKAEKALLEEQISTLKVENAKLKGALHMTLVERVVDTKIALGMESVEDRESLIGEHSSRTASSLADSLRDLAKTPAIRSKLPSLPEVMSEAEVVAEDNVLTVDSEKSENNSLSPQEKFEQLFVDTLMGRRKL
jgi:hypothetical protein